MKNLEQLELIRTEAKSLLDSSESELIDIVSKIDSLKNIYKEQLKMYANFQKNFIKADTELNKAKKNL